MTILTAATLFILALLALIAAHVFPWRYIKPLVNERNELHSVACYVVGVSIIMVIFAVWSAMEEEWWSMLALVIICVGAGLGTTGPRIIKAIGTALDEAEAEAKARVTLAEMKEKYERRIKEIEAEARNGERSDSDSK